MHFSQILANSIHTPWKDQYVDYVKLKRLLGEDGSQDVSRSWTEDDESQFCNEMLGIEFDKVASFQESTFRKLERRAIKVGERLRDLAADGGDTTKFTKIKEYLDNINTEMDELKKYSKLNYTALMKIAKLHDEKKDFPNLSPKLQVSLSKHPFQSEQAYSSLASKLSMMYVTIHQNTEERTGGYGTISTSPIFSLSRYAKHRRQGSVHLPPGVVEPAAFLKNDAPLRIEPKVWLANERTFIKWQHVAILLGTLAVSLYTAAGQDKTAEYMGIAYTIIAVFTGAWGYYMYIVRRGMIVARSGKDFDNFVGPIIVNVALIIALLLNLYFKIKSLV